MRHCANGLGGLQMATFYTQILHNLSMHRMCAGSSDQLLLTKYSTNFCKMDRVIAISVYCWKWVDFIGHSIPFYKFH